MKLKIKKELSDCQSDYNCKSGRGGVRGVGWEGSGKEWAVKLFLLIIDLLEYTTTTRLMQQDLIWMMMSNPFQQTKASDLFS